MCISEITSVLKTNLHVLFKWVLFTCYLWKTRTISLRFWGGFARIDLHTFNEWSALCKGHQGVVFTFFFIFSSYLVESDSSDPLLSRCPLFTVEDDFDLSYWRPRNFHGTDFADIVTINPEDGKGTWHWFLYFKACPYLLKSIKKIVDDGNDSWWWKEIWKEK